MADATGRDDDATLPQQFLDFMNESWTAFHAVATARKMLLAAGFTELSERDPWTKDRIAPGGRAVALKAHEVNAPAPND